MKKTVLIMALILSANVLYAWVKGDRVLGQWQDNLWYPARISEAVDGGYRVMFDDGDVSVLPAERIRKIDWAVGTNVQCNFKNAGLYYKGTITRMNGEMIHISYEDGDQEDATIGRCRSR